MPVVTEVEKMESKKVQAKSQAIILGKSEAVWEIVDWTGPLAHLMRTSAECFVNIPNTEDNSTPGIKLRFYLKPYYGRNEPQLIYCEREDTFKTVQANDDCDCNTCSEILGDNIDDIPLDFLVDTRTRSSGYSLMADVLTGPENFALIVSVDKLNGQDWFGRRDNLVKVNPDSGYQNLAVVDKLWRMIRWMEGQDGEMDEWEYMSPDDVKDARFQLTVTAYQVQAEGSDEGSSTALSGTDTGESNFGQFSIKTDEQEGSNLYSDTESSLDSYSLSEHEIEHDNEDLQKFRTDLNNLMEKFKQLE